MKTLIVYAHNEPSSLTASLKNVSLEVLQAAGSESLLSDLYAQGFHPTAEKYDFSTLSGAHFNYANEQKATALRDRNFAPDISGELQKLQDAELIILHFPVWWFSAPAIMKGWFERVLVKGVTWDDGNIFDKGYLKGKSALVVATAGGSVDDYQPFGVYKATLKQMLYPMLHGTLAYCGLSVIDPYLVHNADGMQPDELHAAIEGYRSYLSQSLTAPSYFIKY